jgi:hypothetical protein
MRKIIVLAIVIIFVLMGWYFIFIFTTTPGPGLAGNERNAINNLKKLAAQEIIWKKKDIDGNGIKDFWTLDVSCFNRMYRANGTTKVAMIDISHARADGAAYSRNNPSPFDLGNENNRDIEDWGSTAVLSANFTTTAKSGYFYRVMLLHEDGIPYNQNPVGQNGIKTCNSAKFAFVAYPNVYPTSGVNTFIINESNIIWETDGGTDSSYNKIMLRYGNTEVLQWPGPDPTKVKGRGGKFWIETGDDYESDMRKGKIVLVTLTLISVLICYFLMKIVARSNKPRKIIGIIFAGYLIYAVICFFIIGYDMWWIGIFLWPGIVVESSAGDVIGFSHTEMLRISFTSLLFYSVLCFCFKMIIKRKTKPGDTKANSSG